MSEGETPVIVKFDDITQAEKLLAGQLVQTPCERSLLLSDATGVELYLKKEIHHPTGSCKDRSTLSSLLSLTDEERKRGVITASLGNHAMAISYHGAKLGIPVHIIMPITAPIMKVQTCARYGAQVTVHGDDLTEAHEFALKLSAEKNMTHVHRSDHPAAIAGHGTMALEMYRQVGPIDAVVVPIGGGGLIAGIAIAMKHLQPDVLIIGVESERSLAFTEAINHEKPVPIERETTLADALSAPIACTNAFYSCRDLVDQIVQVTENELAIAILKLIETEKCMVEGGGAAGIAVLLSKKLPGLIGKRVVVPLCGGNIDTAVLGRVLERGMSATHRIIKLKVVIEDRTTGLSELMDIIAKIGATVRDMSFARAWLHSDIFKVEVRCVVETRDAEHSCKLVEVLTSRYNDVMCSYCDVETCNCCHRKKMLTNDQELLKK